MQLAYDASNHIPQSFDPLPSAWYNVKLIEGLETPVNGKPQSTYFKSVWEVIDGPHKGRKLFHNFNFKNDNEQAVKIAYDQLAAIMHAVGLLKIQTMEQLFEKPLQAKVKLKPAVYEEGSETEIKYEAGNDIKGFKALEGASGAVPGATGGGGLPPGFGDEPQAAAPDAAQASAPAAVIPAAAAAVIPKVEAQKRLVSTAKAGGATFEQFKAHDANWTEQMFVEQGYGVWETVEPAKPAAPVIPAAAAASPAAPASSDSAAATEGDDDTPPWLQGQ